jgi:hypothetical protein
MFSCAVSTHATWLLYWIEDAPLGKYYAGCEGNLHRWTDDIREAHAFVTEEAARARSVTWGPCVRVHALTFTLEEARAAA